MGRDIGVIYPELISLSSSEKKGLEVNYQTLISRHYHNWYGQPALVNTCSVCVYASLWLFLWQDKNILWQINPHFVFVVTAASPSSSSPSRQTKYSLLKEVAAAEAAAETAAGQSEGEGLSPRPALTGIGSLVSSNIYTKDRTPWRGRASITVFLYSNTHTRTYT